MKKSFSTKKTFGKFLSLVLVFILAITGTSFLSLKTITASAEAYASQANYRLSKKTIKYSNQGSDMAGKTSVYTYAYTDEGRIRKETRKDSDGFTEKTVYTYDEVDNLKKVSTKNTKDEKSYVLYNTDGKITKEYKKTYYGTTNMAKYTYDENGNLIKKYSNSSSLEKITETYTYNEKGNILTKTVKTVYNGSLQSEFTEDYEYTYYKDGNVMTQKRTRTYENSSPSVFIYMTTYVYGLGGRMISCRTEDLQNNDEYVHAESYIYNRQGKPVYIYKGTSSDYDETIIREQFIYDGLGRITNYINDWEGEDGYKISYTYDSNGNLVKENYDTEWGYNYTATYKYKKYNFGEVKLYDNAFASLSSSTFTYTGKKIEPKVIVLNSEGKELKQGSDYHVKYYNNKEIGKGKAHVYNYIFGGSVYLPFKIVK